ncbi:MAG: hypothetical protein HGA51_11780 [Demequinaceae bacterium]|nr:hypothetical protein [Demequinaceae bacterium]
MTTTDNGTVQSPGILMIEGREYILYDGFLGRINVAEVGLLWLYSSTQWVLVLTYALLLPFTEAWWPIFIAVVLLLVAIVGTIFVFGRPVMATPVAVVERDRSGTTSSLSVATRRHGAFTLTTHTDMADFLLRAITVDRRRRFWPRRDVPAGLVHPKMMRHVWNGAAVCVAMTVTVVLVFVTR